MLYQQCKLQKESSFQVSYLPEKFAKVGNNLRLKDSLGNWESGWWVIEVYGNPVPEPMDYQQLSKHHRNATGDSMRKVTS